MKRQAWWLIGAVLAAAAISGCSNLDAMPDGEIAWVERGEHQLGDSAFEHDDWVLAPLDARGAWRDNKDFEILGSLVVVVEFEVTNQAERSRRFGGADSNSAYRVALWPGTISDSAGVVYGPRRECANLVPYSVLDAGPLMRAVFAEPLLGQGESIQYAACWALGGASEPPYTLYLGDWDGEKQMTFDLGCVTVNGSQCPQDEDVAGTADDEPDGDDDSPADPSQRCMRPPRAC